MWRRNESAVIVKWSSSPRRSHAAARISRTNTSCCVSVGVNAREVVLARRAQRAQSCERVDVERAAATRARAAPERARARAGRGRRSGTTVPSPRSARGSRRGASSAASDRDVVGQRRVERLGEPLDRRAALGVEARDLPGRVDAGVGAAGDGEAAPATAAPRRAPRAARPRPSARPAAAPSRETRSRRTRASAAASPRRPSSARVTRRLDARARGRRPPVTTTSLARRDRPARRPRASQISPSSCTCPRGDSARTTTAVRPTSVSAPTVARRRFDQRTKNVDLDHVDRGSDERPRRRPTATAGP